MSTPLHSAIRWNKPQVEIEQLLGEYGVHTPDDHGNQPIHIAAQNGHTPLVELLIAHRCDVNAQNNNGQTPLHMAVGYDLDDVEALLRGAGARGDIQNNAGHPANLGIDGDLVQRRAVQSFQAAQNTEEFIASLVKICSLEGIDSAKIAKAGLDKKKNYKESWTPQVQELFTAAVQGTGLPPGYRPPTPDKLSDVTVEFAPYSPPQAVSEQAVEETQAYEPYVPPPPHSSHYSSHHSEPSSRSSSFRGSAAGASRSAAGYEPYQPPPAPGSAHHFSHHSSGSFKSHSSVVTDRADKEPIEFEAYAPPPAHRTSVTSHHLSQHGSFGRPLPASSITVPHVIHPIPHTALSRPQLSLGFRSALEGLPKPAGLAEYRATNQYPPRPPIYLPQAPPTPFRNVHGLYRPAVPFATEPTVTSAAQLWAAQGAAPPAADLSPARTELTYQRGGF